MNTTSPLPCTSCNAHGILSHGETCYDCHGVGAQLCCWCWPARVPAVKVDDHEPICARCVEELARATEELRVRAQAYQDVAEGKRAAGGVS